jgi:hypothetical protein
MEARIVLTPAGEEILRRRLAIEVVGQPKRLYSNFIRGIRSLPVRIS